jgi:hypothetical protein
LQVSEFYPQAKTAFAGCDEATILSRLTDAVRLLSNKGICDPLLGELELCVCNGCVTLPRDVGTVLGIDVCGNPTLIQDQWFKYHINGPGTRHHSACGVITEMGQVCTYRDPSEPFHLIAEITSAADNNKKLRVFANDVHGNKIFTPGPDNKLYEGFLVPMIFGFSKRNPGVPPLSSIYRIQREATKDYVRLLAIRASDGVSQTQIGYYEPDETLPTYRRIKVPNKTSVLVKYKKATLQLRNLTDWINIDNFEALRLACRAVKFRLDDKYDSARAAEEEASRILSEETASQRPAGPRVPQVINGVYHDNDDGLFYGPGGGYYGGPY